MISNSNKADVLIFSVTIPIVTLLTWHAYGYHSAIAVALFFAGMFIYFYWFLNTTLFLKDKTVQISKVAIYAVLSSLVFILTYYSFDWRFALKSLLFALILFAVQLFFILRR